MIANVKKHSVVSSGRKTSISLEDAFWKSLREIAEKRGEPLSKLIAKIDAERNFANLSSAIRLFVLSYYRDQLHGQELMVLPAAPHLAPIDLLAD